MPKKIRFATVSLVILALSLNVQAAEQQKKSVTVSIKNNSAYIRFLAVTAMHDGFYMTRDCTILPKETTDIQLDLNSEQGVGITSDKKFWDLRPHFSQDLLAKLDKQTFILELKEEMPAKLAQLISEDEKMQKEVAAKSKESEVEQLKEQPTRS